MNILDLTLLASMFNKRSGEPGYSVVGDWDGDGMVDIFDLVIVGLNFGRSQ